MLDFLLIFGAALCGFVHAPLLVVVAAAGGLFAMSYARHHRVYERGMELGLGRFMRGVAMQSGWNAVVASGAAFLGGEVIRLLTWH
jgi:hypothetical protein